MTNGPTTNGDKDVPLAQGILTSAGFKSVTQLLFKVAKDRIDLTSQIDIGRGIKFDKTKRVLIKDDGTQIGLTKKELAFLTILSQRMDTLVLHEEIKQNVWTDERVSDAAIRTFVKRIRDKVGVNLIKNISGLGYKISSKDDEI